MENPTRKKSNFERIVSAFLILFVVSIIYLGFSAWQEMTRAGNESNAIDFVSCIAEAQRDYSNLHQGDFAKNFEELRETLNSNKRCCSINSVESYVFEMKVEKSSATNASFFSIRADPKIPEGFFATGTMRFYFDSTLRAIKSTEENRQAKADDSSM